MPESKTLAGLYRLKNWLMHSAGKRLAPGSVVELSHEDAKLALEHGTATLVVAEQPAASAPVAPAEPGPAPPAPPIALTPDVPVETKEPAESAPAQTDFTAPEASKQGKRGK